MEAGDLVPSFQIWFLSLQGDQMSNAKSVLSRCSGTKLKEVWFSLYKDHSVQDLMILNSVYRTTGGGIRAVFGPIKLFWAPQMYLQWTHRHVCIDTYSYSSKGILCTMLFLMRFRGLGLGFLSDCLRSKRWIICLSWRNNKQSPAHATKA